MHPVLDRMMEAVHRYEGTVNQVMGDGMALFGAPLAHEDHAVREAVSAWGRSARSAESARAYELDGEEARVLD